MKYYSEFLPYTILSVALVAFYYLLENKLVKPWMRWLWWVVSVCGVVVVCWHAGVNHGWPDFGNAYYYAGRKIVQHPEVLYDAAGYVNFPLFAYLFVPLGSMPKEEAGRVFFIINEVAVLPLAYWLVKIGKLRGWARWFILCLLALSGPLDYSIWLGNSTSLIMLIMTLALWKFQRGNQWLTGILLGINGLIKIPVIMPAGSYFVRRQWKVVGGGALVVVIVFALSILLIPSRLNWRWVNERILAVPGNPLAAYNNQSVVGVLAREFIPDSNAQRWIPSVPTLLFKVLSRFASVLIYFPMILILLYRWKIPRSTSVLFLEFFIVLLCSLLTSPISWTHYYMFVIVAVAFYFDDANFMPGKHFLNLLLCGALLFLTLPVNMTLALHENTEIRLSLSIHFIGGVLFYIFLLWAWRLFWEKNQPMESDIS